MPLALLARRSSSDGLVCAWSICTGALSFTLRLFCCSACTGRVLVAPSSATAAEMLGPLGAGEQAAHTAGSGACVLCGSLKRGRLFGLVTPNTPHHPTTSGHFECRHSEEHCGCDQDAGRRRAGGAERGARRQPAARQRQHTVAGAAPCQQQQQQEQRFGRLPGCRQAAASAHQPSGGTGAGHRGSDALPAAARPHARRCVPLPALGS